MKIRANHIEIPVKDISKAKQYYGELFDWKKNMTNFSEDYVLVADDKDPNEVSYGLFKATQIPKSGMVITMGVNNIELFLKKAVKLGGKITKEKYEISPEIGYGANFSDIFGIIWGLHESPK